MSTLVEIARTRVAGLQPYRAGKPPAGHLSGKLSANESAFGPGPAVLSALQAAATAIGHYPREDELLDAVSLAYQVPTDSILITNGSDELCNLIATVFLGPGRTSVVGDPCYAIDATATLVSGAKLVRVPLDKGGHDLALMAAAAQEADVLWIPTPHNPTGVAIDARELMAFLESIPSTCLVVLDLAYADFAEARFQLNAAELISKYSNVLIQRTLSKSKSLAGLRVGLAFANPELVQALRTVRLPFSVNSLGVAAARAAIEDPSWSEMNIARVREGRDRLQEQLTDLGIEFYPSQSNFVLIHVDHAVLAEPLGRLGLTVRNGADLGIPGWTRITVGWAPVMSRLHQGLQEALAQSPDHPSMEKETS